MSEIRRLRILEAGSSELQKLIIMYFPSVSGIVSSEVPEANVREGAVFADVQGMASHRHGRRKKCGE